VCEGSGTDEVVLVLRHAEPHAALIGGVARRQIAAEVAVALLDPQRLEHAVAAGPDAVARAGRHQAVPGLHGPVRREVELIAELADEGDPLGEDRHAAERDLTRRAVGEC
jgi:hypothetical protein